MTKRNKLFSAALILLCATLAVTAFAQGDVDPSSTPVSGPVSSAQQAEEIALAHAGLTADQVARTQTQLERDDGVEIYDVEFYTDEAKYDYDVVVSDGHIRAWEYDVLRRGTGSTEVLVSQEQAWEIVRTDAAIPENAEIVIIQEKLEYDDGFRKYELDFTYETASYEYDVDANTGDILSIQYEEVNAPDTANGYVSEEQALAIALEHAGLTESDVSRTRVETEQERTGLEYEIEFISGRYEYEYTINAATGEILSFERDRED